MESGEWTFFLCHSRLSILNFQLYEAGEGNRTLVFSLEGCGSTIELHPLVEWPMTNDWGQNIRDTQHRFKH